MRGETRIRWRSNDDLTTGHTLSNIIISLTLQDQAHTRQAKRAKTLSSRPLKGTGHAYSWQSHVPIAARNLTREARPNGSIIVMDLVLHQHAAFSQQRLFSFNQYLFRQHRLILYFITGRSRRAPRSGLK